METGRCKAEAGGTPPPAVAMETGRCKAEAGGTPLPAVVETVETKFTSTPLDEKKSLFPGDSLHVEPCAHASILPGEGNNNICTTLLSSTIHVIDPWQPLIITLQIT